MKRIVFTFAAMLLTGCSMLGNRGTATVSVHGLVAKPGHYTFEKHEHPSIVALADKLGRFMISDPNDPDRSTNADDVLVLRRRLDGSEEVFVVNMREAVDSGDQKLNLPLVDGDKIIFTGSYLDM